MSNSTNQFNQKLSNLYGLSGSGGGGGSQTLAQVLAVVPNGNDAGGLDILNVDNLQAATINGSPYIPSPPTPGLSSVLSAGNTATNSITLNNGGTQNIQLLPASTNSRIILTDGTNTNTISGAGYSTLAPPVSNDTHYLLFTNDFTTNNGADTIQKSAGISCIPSATPTITATNFAGTATNATNVRITETTSPDASQYPTFVDGTSSNRLVRVNTSFTFNPSTNILTLSKLVLSNLPTSSAGLPAGSVWNNAGVLNIV